MPEVDLVVVLIATVLTFVSGAVYYVVLGARLAAAPPQARTRRCRR